jgi:hypothetical protein
MRGRGSWVIAVLVVGLAGCGAAASSSGGTASSSGGTASSSGGSATSAGGVTSAGPAASVTAAPGGNGAVTPGHGTPEEAADGLIQAELAGNLRLACSYAAPAQQASCRGLQITLPKGHVSVVGALTSGDRALVEITGQICMSGNGCERSTNARLGLPKGSQTFTQAYDKALTSGGFSPVPCLKVNGKWYVNFATG